MDEQQWHGEERREVKRRYTVDRRVLERRKKYLLSVVMPTLLGIFGAGLVSWGAYVTHSTYTISAKYEQGYLNYVDKQAETDRLQSEEIERIVLDYTEKILDLHRSMDSGFKEIRDTQRNIFGLLLSHDRKRISGDEYPEDKD